MNTPITFHASPFTVGQINKLTQATGFGLDDLMTEVIAKSYNLVIRSSSQYSYPDHYTCHDWFGVGDTTSMEQIGISITDTDEDLKRLAADINETLKAELIALDDDLLTYLKACRDHEIKVRSTWDAPENWRK